MIVVVDFKKEHYFKMTHTEATKKFMGLMKDGQLEALEKTPYSRSFMEGNEVVACAGIIELWEGRGEAWAMLNPKHNQNMIGLIRWFGSLLDNFPIRRIEAPLVADYEPGIRLAKLLKFKKESGLLKHFFPDGRDAIMYARIN